MNCPKCGKPNNCFIDNGKEPMKCWCHGVEFPKNMPGGKSCLCKDCVIEMKRNEIIDEIKEAERTFMMDSLELGSEGWTKHFMFDAAMIATGQNKNVYGKENIFKTMSEVFNGDLTLTWEPEDFVLADDYSICIASGKYVRTVKGEEQYGRYLTVWRRTLDGWKVQMDIGN